MTGLLLRFDGGGEVFQSRIAELGSRLNARGGESVIIRLFHPVYEGGRYFSGKRRGVFKERKKREIGGLGVRKGEATSELVLPNGCLISFPAVNTGEGRNCGGGQSAHWPSI